MFVEGKIHKDFYDLLIAWGHEPDWVCRTSKEAAEKGYELELNDDVVTRIWIDMDLEDFFPLEDIAKDQPDLLGLMAVSRIKKVKEFAERMLRNGMAEEK